MHTCITRYASLPMLVLASPRPAEIKTTETVGPVLLHVVTEKGRGYLPAESASDKMHGVVQYDTVTGQQKKAKTQVSAETCQTRRNAAWCAVERGCACGVHLCCY